MEKHNYRTNDEYYFSCYLNELIKKKFVKSFKYEPFAFILTEGLKNKYTKTTVLKTKTKTEEVEQLILRGSEYTPDFIINWLPAAYGIFYNLLFSNTKIVCPFIANNDGNSDYSIVECKPDFDANNMTRLFINNQKIIWDKYEKYVNLIKNVELFQKTFTPKEYLLTPTGKDKKLHYKPVTLTKFLKSGLS